MPLPLPAVLGAGALAAAVWLSRRASTSTSTSTSASTSASGWTTKSGVSVSADVAAWLDQLAARVGHPIVVTSAARTPAQQAAAMAEDHARGVDLLALYAQDDLVEEVLYWYPDVGGMTAAIEDQVAAGRYISDHLRADAVDLRTRDLTSAQVSALASAVAALGARAVVEDDHLHVEDIPGAGGGWV